MPIKNVTLAFLRAEFFSEDLRPC